MTVPDFESLDAIAQTDALLDAIAGERRFTAGDPEEQALVAMLEGWRDGVRRPSTHGVVTEPEAAAALRQGTAAERRPEPQPHSRRGLTMVVSTAAAVLCIGGFGAVVAGSGPGDSLYGLRTALFGEQTVVRDDKVALAAQTEMAQVQQMIDQGDWDQAQQKLQAVSTQVQSVDDVTTKTDLIQQWNELSVKVGTRDANATLPPSTPGEPAAPPPAGVTLLELPAATSTTTTTVTTSSEDATTSSPPDTTTSGETTSGETTSGESTTSAPGTTTSGETTSAPVTTTTSAPVTTTTSTPVTTTSAPVTTTTSAPVTTTTSAPAPAPAATSAPVSTTAAPATPTTSAPMTTTTTTAPATEEPPAVGTTNTAPAAPPRTKQQTTTSVEVAPAPAPEPAQEAPATRQHQEDPVTTTMVPAPAG
jgi:Anti-sigma-D factor RsdA to sigma factor binding region